MNVCAVIMAAGEGKRMNSKKCKFVQKAAGRPIISWVRNALCKVGANEQVYIVGHLQDQVRQVLGEDVAFVLQDRQLGTGHAVMQASPFLEGRLGITLVMRGDTPLITSDTLKKTIEYFKEGSFAAVVITSETRESGEHGIITRKADGSVKEICRGTKENLKKNDNPSGKNGICEQNSSIYCFDTSLLVSSLGKVGSKKNKRNYCLTDAINILITDGRKVGAYKAPYEETLGVHDKYGLMQVSKLVNRRICKEHMLSGVTINDPDTVRIEASVKIQRDAEILSNTILEGDTHIGEDAVIGPDTRITDSVVEDEAIIYNSIVADSKIGRGCCVGPYSYIKTNSVIGDHSRIGNSVEVRNSNVGAYSKALNISLIADSDLGKNVSYGCGCITVNFDGNIKNRTKIGENSFIGSNSNLIAPVNIAENTYIAAGSTITDDVPAYSMAIARNRQIVKEEWVLKKNRVRMSKNKH